MSRKVGLRASALHTHQTYTKCPLFVCFFYPFLYYVCLLPLHPLKYSTTLNNPNTPDNLINPNASYPYCPYQQGKSYKAESSAPAEARKNSAKRETFLDTSIKFEDLTVIGTLGMCVWGVGVGRV